MQCYESFLSVRLLLGPQHSRRLVVGLVVGLVEVNPIVLPLSSVVAAEWCPCARFAGTGGSVWGKQTKRVVWKQFAPVELTSTSPEWWSGKFEICFQLPNSCFYVICLVCRSTKCLSAGSRYITSFTGIPKVFVQLPNNAFDFLYKEKMPVNCAFTHLKWFPIDGF